MNSYNQLEFDKIKRILASLCHSVAAKRSALSLVPFDNAVLIRERQLIIKEIQQIVKRGHDYDFREISDLKPLFDHYEHLTYSYEEFKKIYKVVVKTGEIAQDITEDNDSFSDTPGYCQIVARLFVTPEISKKHEMTFDDEGEVLDSASPALKEIRKRQSRIRQNVLNLLQKKFQDKSIENAIQDKIITLRDDRYVIPLKEGTIGTVPGIIHGYSGSKATMFVEPNEAIGMNNDIHQLRQEEKEEIFRIMREFTQMIQQHKEEIVTNYDILIDLDFLFAIARLGNNFEGTLPLITEKRIIKLHEARHPLLLNSLKERERVIPFDLSLGEEYNILVLSGPNTGGKTVTLKAIGLLTIMALCGLPIPAREESEIGIFNHILADIGDQQSLEDSLSTFSAHLRHLNEMLDIGDENTLVLIDEIGAATDPEQGAALAQAILEGLITRKVTGVVTTHYTPLKIYAMQSERCQNAAMQFDPDKHIPTYRFQIGLPGNSFALEIADQLGIQSDILERAKELSGKQNVELTDLLTSIAEDRKELARTKFDHELKLKLLNMKISEYETKLSQIDEEKKSIRQKSIKEAREFLANLQRDLTQEISEIQEKERQEKREAAKKMLSKTASLNKEFILEERELTTEDLIPVKDPKIGEIVWVRDLDGTGEIVALEKNNVKVDFNGILLSTDAKNLFYQTKIKREGITRERAKILSTGSAKTELKVLGMTFDEALPLVESFLDEGNVAGLNRLRIVHGKGTGALREKIRSYLKGLPEVTDFYSPAPEAGGDGVTVVVLNSKDA